MEVVAEEGREEGLGEATRRETGKGTQEEVVLWEGEEKASEERVILSVEICAKAREMNGSVACSCVKSQQNSSGNSTHPRSDRPPCSDEDGVLLPRCHVQSEDRVEDDVTVCIQLGSKSLGKQRCGQREERRKSETHITTPTVTHPFDSWNSVV